MKYFNAALTVVIIIAAACFQVRAEGENKGISFNEYIKTVTGTLPALKKNRLQVDRAKNSLDGAYSSGDVNITGSGSWSSAEDYTTSGRVTDYQFKAGASKKITQTGTTIEAGVGHDTINTEGYGTKYYPSVYVKFSQSVLKNSFGVIDRYSVNNASMKLEIEKLRQAESDKTTLNYYKKLYFSWIEITERLELLNASIKYAFMIEADTDKKYRSGLTGIEDLYNARALVTQYRIQYESLLSERSAVEAEMEVFLGNTASPDRGEFNKMYTEVKTIGYNTVPFVRTQNAEIFRLTKNNLVYAGEVKNNSLLPELNIVAQYTRKSAKDEFSASFTGLGESDYYVGFTASYPLLNTEAESAVRESEIAIEEINAEYEISENAYRTDIEKLVREQDSIKKMIAFSETRINSLEARYATVYKKYKQGNQSLQVVIDALQDITTEKTALFRYKSNLIQGYIDYSDLTR
ncbi:MAG TPA: TolC family protein [Spirochaetota bacterium]|nr:TolC family protein [Spirochaetota bacterium]